MAVTIKTLQDIELNSSTAIADYCNKLRELCRQLGATIEITAAMLQADLAATPNNENKLSGTDARLVAAHLRIAKVAVETAGRQAIKTNASFRRRYMDGVEKAKKRPPIKKDE